MTQRPKRFTSPASTAQFQLRIILEHQDTGTDVESIVIDQNVTVADFAACVAEFTQRVGNLVANYETDPRYNPPTWRFSVGDKVRLTATDVRGPIYTDGGPGASTPRLLGEGKIPAGATGEVVDVIAWGTDDAEVIASVHWHAPGNGAPRSAIVYMSQGSAGDFGLEKI